MRSMVEYQYREFDRSVGKLLRHETRKYLGNVPNIAIALEDIRGNPESYVDRLSEFHRALGVFSKIQMSGRDPGAGYLHAGDLGNSDYLSWNPFPSLQWLFTVHRNPEERFSFVAVETFRDVRVKVQEGEWEFPTKVTDPHMLTSGLLIEGYGLFLERLNGEEGLAREFVLGFEEVLWNEFRDSALLQDVLPWMVEEKEEFSPKMRDELVVLVQAQSDGVQ